MKIGELTAEPTHRIVRLYEGALYKRLVESAYADAKIVLGRITSVMNNGEKTVLTALEWSSNFSSVTTEIKIFPADKDLELYPANIEEATSYIKELSESSDRMIANKERELGEALRIRAQIANLQDDVDNDLIVPALVEHP